MEIDLDKLEQAAKAAQEHGVALGAEWFTEQEAACNLDSADAKFVAAASPLVVLELIGRVRAAEVALRELSPAAAAPEGWPQQVFELFNDIMTCVPMTDAMMACMYESTGDRGKYPNAADWLARAALQAAPESGSQQ